jgi:hypothetical protein
VIPNPIERLHAQIERRQGHIRSPLGMVEAAIDIGIECIFTGVSTWPVSAVMAERYGLGQYDIERERPSDTSGNLSDL